MIRVSKGTRGHGFSLIELIVVVAVMIVLAAMAVPSFGTTLARMRIQSNAAQMVQDLGLVRSTAISYQQDLYVYICINPLADASTYYYELFQKDPLNQVHFTPADAPVSGQFVRKDLLYGMSYGTPVNSGGYVTTLDGRDYLVLAFCCGKDNNFRGQPVIVSDTSVPTYTAFSGSVGIRINDASSRTWYVTISPAGRVTSNPLSP